MDLSFYGAKVTFKIIVDPPPTPKIFFWGGGVKIFFIAFLAELGNLESFETMLFFSKIFRLTSNPAGDLVIFFKFSKKNNMVSNDSKLPNSARNAIQVFFVAAENGGGRREQRSRRRFFFKDTNSWGN